MQKKEKDDRRGLLGNLNVRKIFDTTQKMLKTHEMLSSMSRKGDCRDNAVAESLFGSLKTEQVFFTNYKTREEARRNVIDYIEMFYKNKRSHSCLGYLGSKEFEELWLLKEAA